MLRIKKIEKVMKKRKKKKKKKKKKKRKVINLMKKKTQCLIQTKNWKFKKNIVVKKYDKI